MSRTFQPARCDGCTRVRKRPCIHLPPYTGPVTECCGQPAVWMCQLSERVDPTLNPRRRSNLAAGPWRCQADAAHRGGWIDYHDEPGKYAEQRVVVGPNLSDPDETVTP